MLVFLSVTKLFSYTEPHRIIFSTSEKDDKEVRSVNVPDLSRSTFLSAENTGFPSMLSFAGERIPLENQQVLKKMDRALKKHYPHLDVNLKLIDRNPRTMSVIDRTLHKYGIPADFRYLPVIESRLSRAVSHKGAGGYWQFMPSTARALGLVVNESTDERNDLVKSTSAACKYIKTLYQELGSWTLAAAAYNIGQGALRKEIKKQGTGSYYFLDLNRETERYLYRLVAMKELLDHPAKYRKLFED